MRPTLPAAREGENEQRPDDERENGAGEDAARNVESIEQRDSLSLRPVANDDRRRVLEVGEHLPRRRVALPGRALDGVHDDLFDLRVDAGHDLAGGTRILVEL